MLKVSGKRQMPYVLNRRTITINTDCNDYKKWCYWPETEPLSWLTTMLAYETESPDIMDEVLREDNNYNMSETISEHMNTREYYILIHTWENELSYIEIGKELGISPERVRQIAESAFKKIKTPTVARLLRQYL